MPPRRKSPIEPLVRLREDRADAAARALSDAARASEAKEMRAARERTERERVERDLALVRQEEERALGLGLLSAGDLAQAARWAIEEARRRDAASAAVDLAAREARDAATEVVRSRAHLATAKADVDAAARLVARARAEEQARELAALEEAGDEAYAARQRGRR